MPDFKAAYREYLNTIIVDVKAEMREQKRRATREAINSLRVVENQFLNAQIRGVKYFDYLRDHSGSKPRGIGRELVSNLMEWMKFKGIQPERRGKIEPSTEGNYKRSAFGIAQNMVDNGNEIYRGQKGIDFHTPIRENMPELLEDMGRVMVVSFTDKLTIKRT